MTVLLCAMWTAFRRLLADKAARATMLLSIMLYSGIYPQPYVSEVVRDVPVAVVDQDGSSASRDLIRRIDATDSAAVVASLPTLPDAQALFFAREVSGVVVIPPDFERELLDGNPSPIAVYGDASYFLIYSAISTAVSSAAGDLGAEVQYERLTATGVDPGVAMAMVSPVAISSIALFNPQGGYASYVVPAAFVLILQQTLLMGIGVLHAGRRADRWIDAIAAPLVYILLYGLWIAVTQILLPFAYGIERLGSWEQLYALAIPFLLAVTALGFVMAQLAPSREAMVFTLVVMGVPLFFISGISWPVESMPKPLWAIAALIPSTTAITAFVRVDQMGSGLAAVSGTIVWQLVLTAGYTLAALLLRARGRPLRTCPPEVRSR
ncbi:ABC transporter permease [Sinirhodobacter populi]|uniref:ABC transporter permease n=1 Tax=Paenirhodobacter populi TaxID=2306993 RepID=A0A443JZS9_9RHOB|nr:ABC transporter permease [Sinirhodobacter populi]RWR26032.1 ABC transporter permease [Sinirhodobacter populi]